MSPRQQMDRIVPEDVDSSGGGGDDERASFPTTSHPIRVAVVGGGVAGLAAAWHIHQTSLLSSLSSSSSSSSSSSRSRSFDVHLFESDDRLGGHAHTVKVTTTAAGKADVTTDVKKDHCDNENNGGAKVDVDVDVDVDIGFMVFNHENYPNMVRWFDALNRAGTCGDDAAGTSKGTGSGEICSVMEEDSDMSLSVSLDCDEDAEATTKKKEKGGKKKVVEWSSDGLSGLLASGMSQLLSPSFHSFLRDMMRFNSNASDLLRLDPDDPRRAVTMKQYLRENGYGEAFCLYYLLPMMAALWSASLDEVLDFPAEQLVGFLCNHKMLQIFHRPQWKTVAGRSRRYTEKVGSILGKDRVHLSTPIVSLKRVSPLPSHSSSTDGNKGGGGKVAYELFTYSSSSAKVNDDDDNDDGGKDRDHNIEKEEKGDGGRRAHPTSLRSLGTFDHVVFASHPPQTADVLRNGAANSGSSGKVLSHVNNDYDEQQQQQQQRLDLLSRITYSDNVVYVHSDPNLMPKNRNAWSSWNCLGKYDELRKRVVSEKVVRDYGSSKIGESMEGGESGFGNAVATVAENGKDTDDARENKSLEGPEGRMKAVYVTYWLNRLQNLGRGVDKDRAATAATAVDDVFVSLNPHVPPRPDKVHAKRIMAHPQFTPDTLRVRSDLKSRFQGKDNLWFCGAWDGYGFHEDGCRSGLDVATALTGEPVPWVGDAEREERKNEEKKEKGGGEKVSSRREIMVLPPPDLSRSDEQNLSQSSQFWFGGSALGLIVRYCASIRRLVTYDLPVAVCRRVILSFLRKAIRRGRLDLKLPDGSISSFGDGRRTQACADDCPVTIRVFDEWFFVKTAMEYDLGMARSYMSGHFVVEPLPDPALYDPVIRPPSSRDETNVVLGDPVGLTRLFLLFIANRDDPNLLSRPAKSAHMHSYANALSNASGLFVSKVGSFLNFLRYKLTMDNSERGGSLRNIHAHYDLSNDLFAAFLDRETYMYSSAIYDAVRAPSDRSGLVFRGTLEDAQWRKLDTLLDRAQIRPGQTMLDIGFGWGGLCIHAARKYGCKVTGITLSVEQMALAKERVKAGGLEHLITFEVVDYRTFARRKENQSKFDRVLSCEMIEAVGHEHLGEFFWAVEQVLSHDGVLVMEAITTPEARYETYRRSTDFINTIIFPGSCCPSLHALIDAAYQHSRLTLEHIDNIGLHYARTLAEWRRRFNANEALVRRLGFDDIFMRVWNYYMTYCEAGFHSQTENCLILVFSRPGCGSLVPLCETRSVTQHVALKDDEITSWLAES